MKIDITVFHNLVDRKYISVQKHETADLLIWNYSQRCQFERYWTPETRMARGLITDSKGNIIARPFSKFFNYSFPLLLGYHDYSFFIHPNVLFHIYTHYDRDTSHISGVFP